MPASEASAQLQTLLSSHGGIDSEEALNAIAKHLRMTRERVRTECANVLHKGFDSFIQVVTLLNEDAQASSAVDPERGKLDTEALSQLPAIVRIRRLIEKFEALGFQLIPAAKPSAPGTFDKEKTLLEDQLEDVEAPTAAASEETAKKAPPDATEDLLKEGPVGLVTASVNGLEERLKLVQLPSRGRFVLYEQDHVSLLDSKANVWKPIKLFLLTDCLVSFLVETLIMLLCIVIA
jgi:hypothetical protein